MVLLFRANFNIKNLFLYDLGVELYITNNINYLYNYKEVEPITINIEDNSLTILKYGEVKITLKYGKRKRLFILKKVAYYLDFHTNIVCGSSKSDSAACTRRGLRTCLQEQSQCRDASQVRAGGCGVSGGW